MSCFIPERIGVDLAVAHLAQSDIEEGFMGALESFTDWQAGEFGHIADETNSAHISDEGVILWHVADAAANLGSVPLAIEAKDASRALGGRMKTKQRINERGFSGTVRAKQTDCLAL